MSFELEAIDKDTDRWQHLYKLFRVTDPHNLGYGRDVKVSEDYTGLTPVCAWSIEAPSRFDKYCAAVEEMGQGLSSNGLEIPKVTTKLDEVAEEMFETGLNDEANEKVLLHGTRPETLLTLLQNGLSERFSGGLFGSGSYFAEDPSKIDQYCTPDTQEGKALETLHTMLFEECDVKPVKNMFYALVVRVALGYPVFTKDGATSSSPPHNGVFATDERRELSLIPSEGEFPVHYHSLIAEAGPPSEGYKCARHREFIVFDSARIIEEYIIGYIRDLALPHPGALPQEPQSIEERDGAAEAEGAVRSKTAASVKPPTEVFPVGLANAVGIAISPCGTFALVGNDSDEPVNGKIGHIDIKTGKLTFPYAALSGKPVSVAIAPDGTYALIADRTNDQISRIDLPSGKLTEQYAKPGAEVPNQVSISPCGTFALIACEDNKIAHIDLSRTTSGEVTFPYEQLDVTPEGVAIADGGKFAIVSQARLIIRLDLNKKALEEKHEDGRLTGGQVAIAPSSNFALITAGTDHARLDLRTDELAFVDDYADDGLEIQGPMGVSIAPSETFALLACNKTGKVYCIPSSASCWKPIPAPDYTLGDDSKKCSCAVL